MGVIQLNHLQVAGRVLDRIAATAGEGNEFTALMMWRETQGISSGALEIEASRSAEETVEEIKQLTEGGEELTYEMLSEYLMREFMAAFQLAWIVHARMVQRIESAANSDDDE